MPWKEKDVLNLRTEFVLRALHGEMPFATLCREYGISLKTGYKWKERFLERGREGLHDRSRRPKSCPKQTAHDEACGYVRVKLAHRRWGPKKVREVYARSRPGEEIASLSTVKRILDKAGLVERRRRRPAAQCGRIENRVEAQRPNQVWTVDFKGWWYSAQKERIEPLTVRDAYSRYVLCAQALGDSSTQAVRRRFERLFEAYGLPETIRSGDTTRRRSNRTTRRSI
jgi:transposase InsO family protein